MRSLLPILAVAAAAVLLVAFAWPAGAALQSTGAWCALVIKVNTKYGTMKNKRYLPLTVVSRRAMMSVIKASVSANKAAILAVTPSEIKRAQAHELAYFASLVAHGFAASTPIGSFTAADATQLTDFQHAHCGITGP
jgi:hypothetical protein